MPLVLKRAIGAWFDAARNGSAFAILLSIFVVAWMIFLVVAYAATDLHLDHLEVYQWSRTPSAGYDKHPPLAGLVAALWFAVFPAQDWSFQLLGTLNSALALVAVDLVARRHLSGDKRLFLLLLLLLTPYYSFRSQPFSTNQLMLSTWPIAIYCFLRAFETRTLLWSAAAGTAAAALLAKYFSIYLIAGFAIAVLVHPQRWRYLRSPSPWISALAGFAVLAPHLAWLTGHEGGPLRYAFAAHGATFTPAVLRSGQYLLAAAAFLVLPGAVYWFAVRPNRRELVAALWPADAERRMLAALLAAVVLLPPLTAPILGYRPASIWIMQAWFLLAILLLAPISIELPRAKAVSAAALVLALYAAIVLAAPGIAWAHNAYGDRQQRGCLKKMSAEATRAWREAFARPLAVVTGDTRLAWAAAFYSPDRPAYVPPAATVRLQRDGFVWLCRLEDAACAAEGRLRAAASPGWRMQEVELAGRFLGFQGRAARFLLVLVPPVR